jgi:hypothetical protein
MVNHLGALAGPQGAYRCLPWSRHNRARLIAARSSQDFTCCSRAILSARKKCVSAFCRFRVWQPSQDLPGHAMDLSLIPFQATAMELLNVATRDGHLPADVRRFADTLLKEWDDAPT